MTTITSTPAAMRIAQIRSSLGRRSTNGGSAFALQLDSARQAAQPSVFTVGSASAGAEPTALEPTTVPSTAVPSTAVPSTAVPSTAVPSTAVPSTAVPSTAVPSTAVPSTAVTVARDVPYAALFNEIGPLHDISPALLASVAQVESAFDPGAISPAGAQGLMQFMPATAAEMGVDPFDPTSAVDGAARYLRREIDRFGSLDLALAAYNAGPGAVQRNGGVPPFTETQRYVDKVLNALEAHR